MAIMNYLTQCTFDFGALGQLSKVLKGLGAVRPFIVTDPGVKASGLLERLVAALGAAPVGIFAETPILPKRRCVWRRTPTAPPAPIP